MILGVRVAKRFPDGGLWAGTIVKETAQDVDVCWDYGEADKIQKGDLDGEIYVTDSAASGVKHTGLECNCCKASPIPGFCWCCTDLKCSPKICLCSYCYNNDKHYKNHKFVRINSSDGERNEVTNRNSCDHTDVSGIFPGAIVVGGQDWEDQQYSDHDAHGKVGKVVGVEDFVCNGWVQVQWNGNKDAQSYMYRLGFDGKVDIKLDHKESAATCPLYIEHLPRLSELCYQVEQPVASTVHKLQAWDRVSVSLEADALEDILRNDPGQLEKVKKLRGGIGLVTGFPNCGKVTVKHRQDTLECPEYIFDKIPVPVFQVGDIVQVIDDIDIIRIVQVGHGGWDETMMKVLGKTCRVHKVDEDSDVFVKNDATDTFHLFNPRALLASTSCTNQMSTNVDEATESGELCALDKACSQKSAASMGSTLEPNNQPPEGSTRNDQIEECKTLMLCYADNAKEFNPLHRAVFLGQCSEARQLMKSQPGLIKVPLETSGYTALHIAVHSNNLEMVKLLLTSKIKSTIINHRNRLGQTPLHIAANQGEFGLVEMLVKHGADSKCADNDGDTALTLLIKQQVRPVSSRSGTSGGGDATKNKHGTECSFCLQEAFTGVFFSPCGHKLCFGCSQDPETTKIRRCCKCNSYVRKVISMP